MARQRTVKPVYKEYSNFVSKVGHGMIDNVDVTYDGYPLTPKEAKFINLYIANGNLKKCLSDSGLTLKDIANKDYIADEITYRLNEIKKATIADADEILQYLTRVMRGEEKDQFGLDAPLSERTAAARELAKRVIDLQLMAENNASTPEVKITLNWDGMQ